MYRIRKYSVLTIIFKLPVCIVYSNDERSDKVPSSGVREILSICLFLFVFTCCYSENERETTEIYPFIDLKADTIGGDSLALNRFYEKLYRLQTVDSIFTVVQILHIGDSHLQAGFVVEPVREKLQEEFGNAGRGLIAPLRLSRSNEPSDYRITSTGKWTASRSIQRNPAFEPGITGISINSDLSPSEFNIDLLKEDERFNKITIFYDEAFDYQIDCPNDTILYAENNAVVLLSSSASSVDLKIEQFDSEPIRVQGFSLENGKPGVLYHSTGINGAHYYNYAGKELFLKQSHVLDPALIIVSLGTNEAYNSNFKEDKFYMQIDSLIRSLREVNPDADILLTTPGESFKLYKKTRVPNTLLEKAGNVIIRYARDNGLAWWDLYSIAGGSNASRKWNAHGLMAKDGIHFNKKGYKLQGDLLYQALSDGYKRYISDRRK